MATLSNLREQLEKIPVLPLVFLYFGYLGYDYYTFANDPGSPLNLKVQESRAAKDEIARLSKKVNDVKTFLKGLNAKREELRRLAQKLEDTKATLSDSLDVPAMMKSLLIEAKRAGLSVQSMKPGDVSRQEYYIQHSFDVAFRGAYVQLLGFLDRLSNLQKIVRVDDFTMKPVAGTALTARYIELEGRLTLKAFRYSGSKADEIGKKEVAGAEAPKENKEGKPAAEGGR